MIRLFAILVVSGMLASCGTVGTASVKGECTVFQNPGRAVKGASRQDQRDIDTKWIEAGVGGCGWPRPIN